MSSSYTVDKYTIFCLANRTPTDEIFSAFASDYVTSPILTICIEIKRYVFVTCGPRREGGHTLHHVTVSTSHNGAIGTKVIPVDSTL